MQKWFDQGFELNGTRQLGVYIASKPGKHLVLVEDVWGNLNPDGPSFRTADEARQHAASTVLV